MWSGTLVAHTTPMQEDLSLILTQTQMAFLEISHLPSFRQRTQKRIHLLVTCDVMLKEIIYPYLAITFFSESTQWAAVITFESPMREAPHLCDQWSCSYVPRLPIQGQVPVTVLWATLLGSILMPHLLKSKIHVWLLYSILQLSLLF